MTASVVRRTSCLALSEPLRQLLKTNTNSDEWFQPWGRWMWGHIEPIPAAEQAAMRYSERTGVSVSESFTVDGPEYVNDRDTVVMPPRKTFETMPWFYFGLFHELAHSTGSPGRINRPNRNLFGSCNYAIEEMIAEVAADCVMCDLGLIDRKMLENTAMYLNNWKGQLNDDMAELLDLILHQRSIHNVTFDDIVKQGRQAADYLLDN